MTASAAISMLALCKTCKGLGVDDDLEPCPICGGSGIAPECQRGCVE
jgi:RNA polymerase subunit RPABC4/transcription elongation factor Spt4